MPKWTKPKPKDFIIVCLVQIRCFFFWKKKKLRTKSKCFGSEVCFNVMQSICDPGKWNRRKLNNFSNKSKEKKINEMNLAWIRCALHSTFGRNPQFIRIDGNFVDGIHKNDYYASKKIERFFNVYSIQYNTIQNGIRLDDGWKEISFF